MKGASEYVLKACTHYMNENGEKILISDANEQQFNQIITHYAS